MKKKLFQKIIFCMILILPIVSSLGISGNALADDQVVVVEAVNAYAFNPGNLGELLELMAGTIVPEGWYFFLPSPESRLVIRQKDGLSFLFRLKGVHLQNGDQIVFSLPQIQQLNQAIQFARSETAAAGNERESGQEKAEKLADETFDATENIDETTIEKESGVASPNQ